MTSGNNVEPDRIPIRSEADIVAVRRAARELCAELGFSSTQTTVVATAISEIARNIVVYAGFGEMTLRLVIDIDGVRRGIKVTATDRGPGIANIPKAMQDGYTTGNGMGLGLPGARRLMDDFHIASAPGEGTTIVMTKWTP